jgi:DNA uptake protein ComE-like DNA-binding protein
MLAWVPPGRAFLDGGRLLHLHAAVALAATAALAVLFVLYAVLQAEPRFLTLAAPAALTAAAGGALVDRRLQRGPVRPGPNDAGDADDAADPAVEAALRARARREAARRLAERDPALARDLRVGRPDLPSDYDDGGLVDVNSVPAAVLVAELGLCRTEAEAILRVRGHVGGFRSPDDLVALAGLEQRRVDGVADRLLALG